MSKDTDKTDPVQTFRCEVRFDVTGTLAEARAEAERRAGLVDGEVTDIADEQWNSV